MYIYVYTVYMYTYIYIKDYRQMGPKLGLPTVIIIMITVRNPNNDSSYEVYVRLVINTCNRYYIDSIYYWYILLG